MTLIGYIFLQMICDADCLITNLEAKWPGSVHDSRIFWASRIHQRLSLGKPPHFFKHLEHQEYSTCKNYVLYSQVSSLVCCWGTKAMPVRHFWWLPLQTPKPQHSNHAHAKTRARIEMTFGLLKSWFQCLHHLRVSPDRACDVTVACTIFPA